MLIFFICRSCLSNLFVLPFTLDFITLPRFITCIIRTVRFLQSPSDFAHSTFPSSEHRVQTGSGAHAASYPRVPGSLSLEIKWPRCEADHSPPSSAEVKNAWSYTSSRQYAFVMWCSVKAQRQLYLYSASIRASSLLKQFRKFRRVPHINSSNNIIHYEPI
jgi:hypothetical protein